MSKEFLHLHVHTEYSLLDGACSIKNLVKKAISCGATALAITDHGNMYGAIKFYDQCVANKIKPIIGCEFYTTQNMYEKSGSANDSRRFNHLVLLAKNYDGFLALAKLNSMAFIEGFYYKPRIDLDLLRKHSENLICLSACLGGAIPQYLLANDYNAALAYARELQSIFGKEDFYIELQDHGLEENKLTNPLLIKLAREIGAKLVATNDVHYLDRTDSEMHDVLLCIGTASFIDEENRLRFPNSEFFYKTYDEMAEKFGYIEEALTTPMEIAEKCNVVIAFNQYKLPFFPCPNDMDPKQYLRELCFEGLKRRYKEVTTEIIDRAESELNVICTMGFAEYYLIVWDFIRYAKSQDIPVGAGRGSGVGSIVAYAIEITNVDPLIYNLIFERFLNFSRTSMPDFDIDFCYDRRYEVIDYVKRKYGEDKISQIITFGKLKKKAAIKDVARVFRVPFQDVTKLTKYITDNDAKVHICDLLNDDPENRLRVPELIEEYNNNSQYRKILDIAMKIEDMPRNTSVHAAGVVIYKDVAADVMPLARNGADITTQFDMGEVEKLGFLKMDFLALKTLTDVKMAHDYVKNRYNIDVDFDVLGYDDKVVLESLASGNLDAVFQLESGGMKKFMSRLKPNSLEEIIAGISLYRPGPMDYIDDFIGNKMNPEKISYVSSLLKPILDVTYGVIVYQEQAMFITRALAGYDMTRADQFRAIISKKKIDKMAAEEEVFVNGLIKNGEVQVLGCVRNGISEADARKLFGDMKKFGSYAFNKSHAAAYAHLSYETAFYKYYYPIEFLCAVLNNRISNPDDTSKYMRILKEMNIPLLQPDINHSFAQFMPEDKSIRYGLACVKNVGYNIMKTVTEERRQNGNYKGIQDFISRLPSSVLNKRLLESLIKGGAFDCFGMTRATLLSNYESILAFEDHNKKMQEKNQLNFFDILVDEDNSGSYTFEVVREFATREKLMMEKEMLGMYVTGHPLADFAEEFSKFTFNTSMLPKKHEDNDEEIVEEDSPIDIGNLLGLDLFFGGLISDISFKKTKDGKDLAICVIEDMYDSIEITLFDKKCADARRFLIKDSLVKIKGKLSLRDGVYKFNVSTLSPWILEDIPKTTPSKDLDSSESEIVSDKRVLYINITPSNNDKMGLIDNILSEYKGSQSVKMQIDGKIYLHPERVSNLDEIFKRLKGIVGETNLKIK